MKTLFCLLIALLSISAANAQRINRADKDSAVNQQTRYLTWQSTFSDLKGISLVVIKSSGYVKGSAIVERRIDTLPSPSTSTWLQVGDAFTFTNSASQPYIWPIAIQDGKDYRIKVTTIDSTQKIYLYGALLRR